MLFHGSSLRDFLLKSIINSECSFLVDRVLEFEVIDYERIFTMSYPDLGNVKKILVAKLRHHGDVLLTAPVFSVLRQRFPKATIEAYIYKATLPMLEGHAAIDGFILYDQAIKKSSFLKKLIYEWKLLWQIRKNRYDLVLNLTEGDRGALVAWVSKAHVCI